MRRSSWAPTTEHRAKSQIPGEDRTLCQFAFAIDIVHVKSTQVRLRLVSRTGIEPAQGEAAQLSWELLLFAPVVAFDGNESPPRRFGN